MFMVILQVIIFTAVIAGIIGFILKLFLFSTTDGAVNRLNKETEAARAKQAELNQKVKEADEELKKRKEEADKMAKKILEDAETKAKEERDKLVNKARTEAEEVITKAQRTKDNIRKEIETEMELKMADKSANVMTRILSQKVRGLILDQLMEEFIESLKTVDANQVKVEVDKIDIIAPAELSNGVKTKIEQVLNQKLGKTLPYQYAVDPAIIGGAILKFGSLVLDGSLRNVIAETTAGLKKEIEKG